MSSYLYRQAFDSTIQASFEPKYNDYKTAFYKKLAQTTDPLKENKQQKWLEAFVNDSNRFVLDGIEVNRFKIGLIALVLGEQYKEENNTWRIPEGFFKTDVYPTVLAELRGLISISKEVVRELC